MQTRNAIAALLGFGLLAGLTASQAVAESVFLVKLSDMKRNFEYQILSQTDFKALEKDLQAEAKAFPAAVTLAGKDWRSDDVYKALPFPGTKLSPRKIVGMPERFAKQEEADKKLAFYQDADARKAEREAKKLQELEKKDAKAAKAIKDKQKAKEEDDIQMDVALKFITKHLDELTGKSPAEEKELFPGGKDTNAPAKDAKPDEKGKGKEEAGKALDKAL